MKLITLRLTPDGDENGVVIEVVIDHDPTMFKSSYIRVVRLYDGAINVAEQPNLISARELERVTNHAIMVMYMVYDIMCKFERRSNHAYI